MCVFVCRRPPLEPNFWLASDPAHIKRKKRIAKDNLTHVSIKMIIMFVYCFI